MSQEWSPKLSEPANFDPNQLSLGILQQSFLLQGLIQSQPTVSFETTSLPTIQPQTLPDFSIPPPTPPTIDLLA